MIQDLLAEAEWADALTDEDRRGLTPLLWSHVRPYGEVRLNMSTASPSPPRNPLRPDDPSRQEEAFQRPRARHRPH